MLLGFVQTVAPIQPHFGGVVLEVPRPTFFLSSFVNESARVRTYVHTYMIHSYILTDVIHIFYMYI